MKDKVTRLNAGITIYNNSREFDTVDICEIIEDKLRNKLKCEKVSVSVNNTEKFIFNKKED